jgi:lysyl-tRNA synthetase class 2
MRRFLDGRGFLEVETPLIQESYGGASARPFTTYVNGLGETRYLQISPELYLKRLVIGGFNRVHTISKNFRNEEIDLTHNPEFTMMEAYQAYSDYNNMMELAEALISSLTAELRG